MLDVFIGSETERERDAPVVSWFLFCSVCSASLSPPLITQMSVRFVPVFVDNTNAPSLTKLLVAYLAR